MSPPTKKHRHLSSSSTAGAIPHLGFSPFLRSLSHLPIQKPTSSGPPPNTSPTSLPLKPQALPRRHRLRSEDPLPSDDDEEEEEEEDGAEEEEESGEGGVVQVDFGFFDPKPGDFHGVKLLLRPYLDDRPWDLSGFVDIILEQTTVGTVVKSDNGSEEGDNGEEEDSTGGDGDEGLYAVISALNLGRYESHKCLKEVKEYVLTSCHDEKLKKELWLLLLGEKASEVGLLVCERFVNFPNQAVPPLYNGLFDEIGWATEDEPTEELRDSFRFKFYLLITRVYMKKDAIQRKGGCKTSSLQKIGRCSNKRKVENDDDDDDSVVYIKAEDEIFHKLSSLSFTFDLQSGKPVPPEMKNYKKMGLIMVVESNNVPSFREKLNQITD